MNKACGNEFVPSDIVRSQPSARRRAKRPPLVLSRDYLQPCHSCAIAIRDTGHWSAGLNEKTQGEGVRKRQQLFGHSEEPGSELNRAGQPTLIAVRRVPMRRGRETPSFVHEQN